MMHTGLYVATFMLVLMGFYYTFRKVHRKEDDYAEYKEGMLDEEEKSTEMQTNTNTISSDGFGSTHGPSVEEVRI